jgi:hypothetical protein
MLLVLLPGLDGTGTLFKPFQNAIGPDCPTRVIAYPPNRVLGYPELVALVRPQLPVDEPYVLLGESLSDPITLRIATERLPA